MFVGMVALVIGWLSQLSSNPKFGWIFIALGAILIFGGLWYQGRQSHRTAYHRPRWGWQDVVTLIISSSILVVFLIPIPAINHEAFYYNPYPELTLPPFDPLLGLVMLGLLTPGLFVLFRKNA
jgi:hypothetical protein